MKMRLARLSVLFLGLLTFNLAILGANGPERDTCCFTQHCAAGDVTDCTEIACKPSERCTGEGGCLPHPWADAWCEKKPDPVE